MRLFLDSNVWTNALDIPSSKKDTRAEIAKNLIDRIKDSSRMGGDIEVIVTRFQKDEIISVIKNCYPLKIYEKKGERRLLIAYFDKHFEGCIDGVVQLIDKLKDPEESGTIFNDCSKSNREIRNPGYADLILYQHIKPLDIDYYISFDEEFIDYLLIKGEKAYSPDKFNLV